MTQRYPGQRSVWLTSLWKFWFRGVFNSALYFAMLFLYVICSSDHQWFDAVTNDAEDILFKIVSFSLCLKTVYFTLKIRG